MSVTAPFARGSQASYTDLTGKLIWAPANTLRAQHYENGVGPQILYEPTACQNLVQWSEDWTQAVHVKTNVAVNPNAVVAPDGNATADILTRTSTTLNAQVTQVMGALVQGTTYVLSIFAKANATGNQLGIRLQSPYPTRADAVFDLAAGTIKGTNANGYTNVAAVMVPLTGVNAGWYRCFLIATQPNNNAPNILICPTDASRSVGSFEGFTTTLCDAAVWGMQLKAGNFDNSYFPTAAGGGTRAADLDSLISSEPGGYRRQNGSFLAEGFAAEQQIQPALFTDLSRSVVRDVSQFFLSVDPPRQIEAPLAGRSLTGTAPVFVSLPSGGGPPQGKGRDRGSARIALNSSLGAKERARVHRLLHEAGELEEELEEEKRATPKQPFAPEPGEPTTIEPPVPITAHGVQTKLPASIQRPAEVAPEPAPAVAQLALPAYVGDPQRIEDEQLLAELPHLIDLIELIDEDDRRYAGSHAKR